MLQACSNPFCSTQFSVDADSCPACGTKVPVRPAPPPAAPPSRGAGYQVAKSLLFAALGAAPGAAWLVAAGTTQALVIMLLGMFVGLGLSLPGVSAARVAGGTVGMIAAHNAPRAMRERVMDHFLGESETPPRGPSAPPQPPSDFLAEHDRRESRSSGRP